MNHKSGVKNLINFIPWWGWLGLSLAVHLGFNLALNEGKEEFKERVVLPEKVPVDDKEDLKPILETVGPALVMQDEKKLPYPPVENVLSQKDYHSQLFYLASEGGRSDLEIHLRLGVPSSEALGLGLNLALLSHDLGKVTLFLGDQYHYFKKDALVIWETFYKLYGHAQDQGNSWELAGLNEVKMKLERYLPRVDLEQGKIVSNRGIEKNRFPTQRRPAREQDSPI